MRLGRDKCQGTSSLVPTRLFLVVILSAAEEPLSEANGD